jgi:hypothetical protein
MEKAKVPNIEDYTEFYHHVPFRPLKYVKDENGYGWLCDTKADPHKNLRKQKCWRCDEMAFPTGGR